VALDVLSAVAFALVHGARHYGIRGILVFSAICLVVGNAVENIGIATGIPFGHYRFLDVMGPKLFSVPILLGLAYIGMAYVSWTIAGVLLGGVHSGGLRILALPLVASCILGSWDLAQDPVWSTFLHAWAWRDSGPWFGVPLSNFAGWYLTAFLMFLLFALYLQRSPIASSKPADTWPALVFYALCAAGNVLQLLVRQPVPIAVDASGRPWLVAHLLTASAMVSIFVMGSFVALAAARLRAQPRD
jgi:putative membrane protein